MLAERGKGDKVPLASQRASNGNRSSNSLARGLFPAPAEESRLRRSGAFCTLHIAKQILSHNQLEWSVFPL